MKTLTTIINQKFRLKSRGLEKKHLKFHDPPLSSVVSVSVSEWTLCLQFVKVRQEEKHSVQVQLGPGFIPVSLELCVHSAIVHGWLLSSSPGKCWDLHHGMKSGGIFKNRYFSRAWSFFFLPFSVPARIVNVSRSVSVNEGENVNLFCLAVGRPEPTVTWKEQECECDHFLTYYIYTLIFHFRVFFLFRPNSLKTTFGLEGLGEGGVGERVLEPGINLIYFSSVSC